MARLYKFRGWDVTGQKGWVYGDLVHTKGISKEANEDLYDRIMVGGYEVDQDSVGLFVGLTDDDGKEMYEGDIIHVKDHGIDKDCYIGVYNAQFSIFTMEGYLVGYFRGNAPHRRIIGTMYEQKIEKK